MLKRYQKYIFKLLLSRFLVILFCVSLYSVFITLTKTSFLKYITYSQLIKTIPLILPLDIFQLLPFIYFATIFIVLQEIYSGNELVIFKSLGISCRKMFYSFVFFGLLVAGLVKILSIIYPYSNALLNKTRDFYNITNVIQKLEPNKINKFGTNKSIFFDKITNSNDIENITFYNKKNDEGTKSQILYSKHAVIGYNNFDQLVIRCHNAVITNINIDEKQHAKTYTINAKIFDVLLSSLIKEQDNSNNSSLKQMLRVSNGKKLKQLYKKRPDTIRIADEFHSRFYIPYVIIFSLTCSICILLLRYTNRIPQKKLLFSTLIIGLLIVLLRPFTLDFFLKKQIMYSFYSIFTIIGSVCWFIIFNQSHFIKGYRDARNKIRKDRNKK